MKISVVSTLYRSAPHLEEFHARVSASVKALTDDYEIILVNDGCPTGSLELALRIQAGDGRLTIVDLSRNFGHHHAILAGLAQAVGEQVFLIDCDLEEAPEVLSQFEARMAQGDCDVVYGVQEKRKGGWFERLTGWFFYAAFNWLSRLNMPSNIMTVRLMSQRYVKALLQYGERELFLAGLFHITGFNQVAFPVKKTSRRESTYTLRKKIALFVNSITSFSDKPLVYIFYVGTAISLAATAAAVYLAYRRIVHDDSLTGWTSLIVSFWLLGGLIILFLGVIGIYLSKVFVETKRRPTLIRGVYRSGNQSSAADAAEEQRG
jgi:putative glycosyltransferase